MLFNFFDPSKKKAPLCISQGFFGGFICVSQGITVGDYTL